MYVCVCRAVTDREIRASIEGGARNMRDLRRELGVCSECGKCGPCARQMLAEHREENAIASVLMATQPAL